MDPFVEKPLPIEKIVDRLEDGNSVEVLEVLRNAIHWGDHYTRKTRQTIVDAITERIRSILEDHA